MSEVGRQGIQSTILHVGLVLFTHGFHICEFTYLFKVICNFKSVLTVILKSFVDMDRVVKNWSLPNAHIFSQLKLKKLTSCSSSPTANKFFTRLVSAMCVCVCFFPLVCLSWDLVPAPVMEPATPY